MAVQFITIVLGTLASEDLTTIAAGLLVQRGELTLIIALFACAGGIWVGDLGLWVAGRALGSRALQWHRIRNKLPTVDVDPFRAWFERNTVAVVVGSRFAPGTRLPLYVAAGACGSSFARFAWWSFVAVALWTPVLLGLSAAFGEHFSILFSTWLATGRIVLLAIALVALIVWRSLRQIYSLRLRPGRFHTTHRLAAALSRIWRWEFWPMWLFYAPVAVWTTWLAIRYGGFRTITAANPGMPDGGVVGESKFEILARLPPEWTIPAVHVEHGSPEGRLEILRKQIEERGWQFPLVLKPDVGQRGAGVRLACNPEDVASYIAQMPNSIVVQPYHPGPFEAGIFYYRMPHWNRGRILCITDKHFPVVTGDGRSTIEDLVWAHRRYRMQAATFLARLGTRKHDVPQVGQRVSLGIAGNHAQGAMFTDGRHLITPALEARVDAIAQHYDGFYVGRFDVRYSDREAFLAGEDLAIVELNGATAECTNIYDPDNSLLSAYRQLFVQWEIVFAIGAANRQAGRPVSSTERLIALLRAHLADSILSAAD